MPPTETFDRSKELEIVDADSCLEGIGLMHNVEISLFVRYETTMFGGRQAHRLLKITGDEKNIKQAFELYVSVEDKIDRDTETYRAKHRKPKPVEIQTFRKNTAAEINARLKHLAHEQKATDQSGATRSAGSSETAIHADA